MKKIIVSLGILLNVFILASCFSGGGGYVEPTQQEHKEHEWTSWEIVHEPRCDQPGLERRDCPICGEFEEREIEQISHQYNLVETHEGNCVGVGYERYECAYCGHSYHKDLPQNDNHDFYLNNSRDPYCDHSGTYDGYMEYICSLCGYIKTEVIPNTPCEFIESERYDSTCYEKGYIRYVCTKNPDHFYDEPLEGEGNHEFYFEIFETFHVKRCMYCHYEEGSLVQIIHPDGSIEDRIGTYHTFSDWNILVEPTCNSVGSRYKQCNECGYQLEEELPITHNYDENGVCTSCGDLAPTEGLIYELLTDDTYKVIGISTNPEKIVIPNYYEGKLVSSIGDHAFKGKEFTSIVLPKSITYYSKNAFYDCTNLVDVYYYGELIDWMNIDFDGQDGLSTNTVYATPVLKGRNIYFLNTDKQYYQLTELVIPSSVTEIKDFTFAQFEQLTSVTFHENITSIGVGSFVNCDNLESVDVYAKTIGAGAFALCDKLHTANIQNAVELSATFFDCNNLVEVSLPNTLKSIGDSTFYSCDNLESIILPESLEKMDSGNFYQCKNLKNINIPSSLTFYGRYNFYGCDNLKYNIIDGMYYLGNESNPKMILLWTNENEIVNYTVDSNVRFIEEKAIEADLMESIVIPNTVLGINTPIIRDVNMLTELTTSLYGDLYGYFTSVPSTLTKVELINGEVTSECFSGFTSLKEVIIHDECVMNYNTTLFGDNLIEKLVIPYITSETHNVSMASLLNNTGNLEYVEFTKMKVMDTNILQQLENVTELYLSDCLEQVTGYGYYGYNLPFNEYNHGYYLGSKTNPYLALIKTEEFNESVFVVHDDTKAIAHNALFGGIIFTRYKGVDYTGDSTNPFKYAVQISDDYNEKIELHQDAEVVLSSFYSINALDLEFGTNIKEFQNEFEFGYSGLSLYFDGTINDWLNINFTTLESNPFRRFENIYFKVNGEYKLLKSIQLDESVKRIGDYQFAYLNIVDLKLPNNLEYVGKYSFAHTTITGKFDLGNLDTISDYMFYDSNIFELELSKYVVNINDYAFAKSSITSLVINDELEYIGKNAFYQCGNLVSITMSNSELLIDTAAFYDTNILELQFNGDVNDWLNITFKSLESNPVKISTNILFNKNNQKVNLEELSFRNIEKIGDYQFANFTMINSVSFTESLKEIGMNAFYNTSIREVVVPNSVTYIGIGAFENCYITSIELPFLGSDATDTDYNKIGWIFGYLNDGFNQNYSYFYSLNYVKVTGGEIGDYAFTCCMNLEKVDLGDQTYIGKYAFAECIELEYIDLSNITQIGEHAFNYCTHLYDLYLSEDLHYIGEDAFDNGTSQLKRNVYFNGTVEDWCNVTLESFCSNPLSMSGVMYFKIDGEYTIVENIVVPTSVVVLSDYLFVNNQSIKEVYIPESVLYIGSNILSACHNVEKLTIPYSFDRLTYVFNDGIYNNYGGKLKEVVLLNGTNNEITEYAFDYLLSIEKFTLPDSIVKINYSFNGVAIKEFTFMGTIEQWMNVQLTSNVSNPGHNGANYYFIQEGEVKLLTDVVIPESAVIKYKDHFYGCLSVRNVYLHTFATGVEFVDCINIKNVYYKDTMEKWAMTYSVDRMEGNPNYYGDNFYVYENNEYVKAPETLTLSKEVEGITYNLVGIENIKNLIIPDNIKWISSLCEMTDLENIYYEGSVKNWLKMSQPKDVPLHNFYVLNESSNEYEEIQELVVTISNRDCNFQGIKGLEKITFSENISVVYYDSIQDLPNLKEIIFENDYIQFEGNPIKNCPNLIYNEYENARYLGNNENPYIVLMSVINSDVTELTINVNTKYSQYGALSNCMDLVKITTPILIEELMFYSETNSRLPENLVEIVYTASVDIKYTGIRTLKKVTYKESIDQLTSLFYPFLENSLEEIIFEKDSLLKGYVYDQYNISPNIKYNEYENAYYLGNSDNPYMILMTVIDKTASSINIHPDTVTIAGSAFSGMTSLKEVMLPEKVRAVNANAFYGCENLETVTMKNVEYIGDYAFNGCIELENLDLGEKLEELGKYVFYSDALPRCSKLKSITLPNSLKRLNAASLGGLVLDELIIPDSVERMHRFVIGASTIKKLTIPFIGEDKDHPIDIMDMYFDAKALEYLNITNMTYITSDVNLEDLPNLITLKIKAKVIQNNSIEDLPSLKYLEVEYDSLIGKDCIAGNKELLEVKLITTYDTIGERMFNGCDKLIHIELPETTIVICSGAFMNCNSLQYIVIPESVSTIADRSFQNNIKLFFESEYTPTDFYGGNTIYLPGQWEYVDGVPTPKQN